MGELRYLLDSNILSEPFRPEPNENVVELIGQHEDAIAMSSVTWHEMVYGCERLASGKKQERLRHYLHHILKPRVPIVAYDEAAAQWHAQERARLSKEGLSRAFEDGQIAATAATRELILVTRNVKDFLYFEQLQLENWFESGD